MSRTLITGMSGTGKSTLIAELSRRNIRAIDLDRAPWSLWVAADGDPTGANLGYDWLWSERELAALLAEETTEPLFVAGCASNMGSFLTGFDEIVLLSAPLEIMLDRVRRRDNNPYGKREEEAAQIRENLRRYEPALRHMANREIRTDRPLADVVAELLRSGP